MVKNLIKTGLKTLVLAAVLSGCSSESKPDKSGFRIEGKIKNVGDLDVLALNEITNGGFILVDTANIARDGSFVLEGSLPEKTFCILRFQQGDIALVVDTNSKLSLNIDGADFNRYTVTGSKENEELKELFNLNTTFLLEGQKMQQRFSGLDLNKITPRQEEEIRLSFDSLQKAQQLAVQNYIGALNGSFVSMFATNFLIPDADLAFLKPVEEKLHEKYPNSKYENILHQKVETLKRTDIGAQAPDIVLNDPFGKNVSLSEFSGKVVLIDFWASWCLPCRKENPHNVALYQKYKSKGFEIFGVSLDENREAWIEAINKDKLLWTHGSDLQKWNSPLITTYGIQSIPYTVLIDKDGKIIAKRLTGKALENKLKEIFGF